jgi:hypothetical protein
MEFNREDGSVFLCKIDSSSITIQDANIRGAALKFVRAIQGYGEAANLFFAKASYVYFVCEQEF